MALQRTARVGAASNVSDHTRLLHLELDAPLGFVGGQYIIINSGVSVGDPGGAQKLAKRAYSIVSNDAEQGRFELAVRRIGAGPCSSFMHQLEVGSQVPFTGPWGQYLPEDARPRERTWVIATDTGITAAVGLIRGQKFWPQLGRTDLTWLVPSHDYFLPEAMVLESLPRALGSFCVELVPAVGEAGRVEAARALLAARLAEARPESVYLSGDGSIAHALKADLVAAGVLADCIRLESFFNNPLKKSA